MKESKKTYWKGLEELAQDESFEKYAKKEFPEYLPVNLQKGGFDEDEGSSRRDFLKLMGFGVAAASLAACEAPVRKAIPYLNKPVDIDPGIPNYYASTYVNSGNYCSIVVKTREGRPIKIEGNTLSPVTKGCVDAQVEASVLSLYDDARLKKPFLRGEPSSWSEIDKDMIDKLRSISSSGDKICLVSNTILSPTTKTVIADFQKKFSNVQHIVYDTYSSDGIKLAHNNLFGKPILPSFDFGKADVIVSFAADFLGTWISPIEFTHQYIQNRKLGDGKKTMSRHYHFEANLSLTGANADHRIKVKPSQEGLVVAQLYNFLAKKAGAPGYNISKVDIGFIEKAGNELWSKRGKSLVVSGSNDPSVQTVVARINDLLGNYGKTIDINTPVNYRQGNDGQFADFIKDLQGGRVGAVIFINANPVYNHPQGSDIASGLEKVKLKVSTSDRMNETAVLCDIVAPDNHFMESWDDSEPKPGYYSLTQPVIRTLFDTRQIQESLLTWSGNSESYFDYLRNSWKNKFYDKDDSELGFQTFWDQVLYDGVYKHVTPQETTTGNDENSTDEPLAIIEDLSAQFLEINKNYKADNNGFELVLYQKVGLGDGGVQANNPWLQEMPDPITKATWDNYATMSLTDAKSLGVVMSAEGDTNYVNITLEGKTIKLPVLIQPGQAARTIGIALGYGRTHAGKVGDKVGVNAYPLASVSKGVIKYTVHEGVDLAIDPEKTKIARTQTHQTIMGRHIIQESTLDAYQKDPSAGRVHPKIATSEGFKAPQKITLWKGHDYNNHHWGLIIDMNSCTGCSACIVACQAENNIPVVGKQEVLNRREMHWIRIDRYYSSNEPEEGLGKIQTLRSLEEPSDNPEVTFQPMMCQHCNNAPCETVCPVAATTHSSEGLNQMTYNRCIGTRYCANNCPYKVRRFNWFKYHDNDQFAEANPSMNSNLGKMVLNPDVTVRSRGVMEKCSLCVQRIQAGKLKAKKENRRLVDGEITTACTNSCPADAMIFGDMNDPNSKISKALKIKAKDKTNVEVGEPRAYHVLEELNVNPNVFYLTKIRNKSSEGEEA